MTNNSTETTISISLRRLWRRSRESALAYAGIATIVRIGANLLLLPIVLKQLSSADLALWWVFLSLGALGNLADFGFSTAIIRVYNYLWAGADDFETEGLRPTAQTGQPNLSKLRELNATAQVLYRQLAVATTLLLSLIGSFLIYRPAQGSGHAGEIWFAWGIYLIAIGYSLGSAHWSFACQGINRIKELHAAYMWSGLGYVFFATIFLLMGWGIFALPIATGVRALIAHRLSASAYSQAVPPDATGTLPRLNREMLRKLWPNAWKFGVLSIGAYLVGNSSVLVSSAFLGEEATASFGLTFQIGVFLVGFSNLWLTVKWSQIAILRAQGRTTEMSVIFARRLAFSMVTYVLFAGLLIALGNRALEWKGANTRLLEFPYLVVYLFHLGQQMFFAHFGALTFTENVVPFFKLSIFTGIGLIALSLIMTPYFGMWGLVLSPLLATLACSSWYPVWRGFRGQPLSVRQFLQAALCGRL